MAIDHRGFVRCRGILINNKVYKRGDKLLQEHEQMLLTLFRNVLDNVDTNGWIAINGSNIDVVMFSSTEPLWIVNAQ